MKISDIVSADGVKLCEHDSQTIYIVPGSTAETSPDEVRGFSIAMMDSSTPHAMLSTNSRWYMPEEVAARVFVSRQKCLVRMAQNASQHAHNLLQASMAAV